MTSREFYSYLRSQFSDLNSAKSFASQWARGTHSHSSDEQELFLLEYGKFGECSFRAMAHHISLVLEGYEEEPSFEDWNSIGYHQTKYGGTLYFEM